MDHAGAIAERVRRGEASALAVAEEALARAAALERLGALVFVDPDAVRARAREIDQKRARGEPLGPLAGVPVALKDALVTRGVPTTACSRVLDGWRPPYDGTAVLRVLAADAVVLGKTNMDELAMGSSNETSAFGPCKNPHDEARTPGGSSGGSAAAVAARIVPIALGSDTGGSIRQPAAMCGVVGVKPTYGRVSRYGLVAFASSLDQIGPLASDVRGAARALAAIAGHDPRDATSAREPASDWEADCERPARGLVLGVPEEYFGAGLDPEVEAAVRAAIRALEKEGCSVRPISLPHTRHAVACYYVLATAEASSNLARYDGVRFGPRAPARELRDMIGATRDRGFGREVKRRILLGTFVLSAGYYDAYYMRAQKVRALIRRELEDALSGVDALVTPTAPTPAFRLGEKTDPLSMYLSDVYTLPASLAGLPAASFPCGAAKGGLPVGVQAVARAMDEATLFRLGAALESAFPPRGARCDP